METNTHLCKAFFLALVLCLAFSPFAYAVSVDGNAIAAYRSITMDGPAYPKIKFWNSTANGSWGDEIQLNLSEAGAEVKWAVVKFFPSPYKIVLVTQDDNNTLTGYVCTSNCNNNASWIKSDSIGQVATGAGVGSRRFDIEFETATGDLMLVYGVASTDESQDLAYKILPVDSNSFTGLTEHYINDTGHSTDLEYDWIRLDKNPTYSKSMVLGGFDAINNHINAWVWNGSTWSNEIEISSNASATGGDEALAVRYAADGSKAMVIGSNGAAGNITYRYWDGTSWSEVGEFDTNVTIDSGIEWLNLKADPVSDDMQGIGIDRGRALTTFYWNGSAWSTPIHIDITDVNIMRAADFEWYPSGSVGRVVWDADDVGTTISERACTPECTNPTFTHSGYADEGRWITLYRNPNASDLVNILGIRVNSNADIGSFLISGTNISNYGDANISESDANNFEMYSVAFLMLDTAYPQISFATPTDANGSNLTCHYIIVNVTASDLYLANISIDLYDSSGSLINTTNSTAPPIYGLYVNFSVPEDGTYYFNATACDAAGNCNFTATNTVAVDTTPPQVAFVAPTPNNGATTIFNSLIVNVSFNEANKNATTLNFNNTLNSTPTCVGTTSGFCFWMLVDLIDGATYAYNVTMTDYMGFSNVTETRTVTVNMTYANATIIMPQNITYGMNSAIPLAYTIVGDSDTCWYSVDAGVTNTPIAGCQNTTIPGPLSEGANAVILYVNSTSGILNYTIQYFSVDTQSPSLVLISPANTTYDSVTVAINYTVSDATLDSCWYSIEGENTSLPGCANSSVVLDNGAFELTVYANDSFGRVSQSSVIFTVNDTSAPVISNVSAGSITATGATITWNTDEISNSTVKYGTDTNLSLVVHNAANVTSHSVVLSGLAANTLYYYNVSSCNSLGNCNETGPHNFTTTTVPVVPSGDGGTPAPTLEISLVSGRCIGEPVTLQVIKNNKAGSNVGVNVLRYVGGYWEHVLTDRTDVSGNLYFVPIYAGDYKATASVSGAHKTVFFTLRDCAALPAENVTTPAENVTTPSGNVTVPAEPNYYTVRGTGLESTLRVGDVWLFTLEGTQHKATVFKVGSDYVIFKVESNPIFVTVRVGETKKVDVDADGTPDISIYVASIANGIVNAKINIIPAAIVPPVPPVSNVTKPSVAPPAVPPTEKPECSIINAKVLGMCAMDAVLIIAAVLILLVILYILFLVLIKGSNKGGLSRRKF